MELFWVRYPGRGRLAICTPPRGAHWLEDDLQLLLAEGVGVLASALMPLEERELQLEHERLRAQAAGLDFVAMPTGNLGVPGEAVVEAMLGLHRRLTAGAAVAVHCHASVGRGPTIAAALMVLAGATLEEAWQAIEQARGRAVPDTMQQRAWPAQFAPGRQEHEIPRKGID